MKYKFALIVSAVIFIDQITKLLARAYLSSAPVSGKILGFVYRENTGAGFSLLQDHNLLLTAIGIIIISLLVYFFKTFKGHEKYFASLIIGGAFGNLVDRIFLGYVVDFIYLSFWPTFNIADASITIGAIGLIYLSFRKH